MIEYLITTSFEFEENSSVVYVFIDEKNDAVIDDSGYFFLLNFIDNISTVEFRGGKTRDR